MQPFDVRKFSEEKRTQVAWRIHEASDIQMPKLDNWNYRLCRRHAIGWKEIRFNATTKEEIETVVYDRPFPGCRECGIHFRKHQRVGIMWLYMVKRGLLADPMGVGKTTQAGGLISLLHQTGELDSVGKVIIVPRAPALGQWNNELLRMMPSLNLTVMSGTKAQRREQLFTPWDVMLISPQTLLNDYKDLLHFPISTLITDDVDALRNHGTRTAEALKTIARQTDRFVAMTGTPLQKKLRELHSTLEPIDTQAVLGNKEFFERRYVTSKTIREVNPATGHLVASTVVAYRGLNEVKRLTAPMILRRSIDSLDDVNMPEIIPNDVMLDLYPVQRAKYTELQRGVLQILHSDGGATIKHVGAMAKVQYGAQICGGLASLGEADGPNTSVKMDWIMDKLQGEFEDEKVVIFAGYKNSVRALHERMKAAGIGYVTIWGEDAKRASRDQAQERFWRDKNCKVLIGTQAIEQSLNLQISRNLINMDMILNPARMKQLAGRIRRDGSAFRHVFVHNLLTVDTQEARYLPMLERESALADFIWDESAELFQALSPTMLLQLIAG